MQDYENPFPDRKLVNDLRHITAECAWLFDYNCNKLKVSYQEWPLETYYQLLGRWLDVLKELLHSSEVQTSQPYLWVYQRQKVRKIIKTITFFVVKVGIFQWFSRPLRNRIREFSITVKALLNAMKFTSLVKK